MPSQAGVRPIQGTNPSTSLSDLPFRLDIAGAGWMGRWPRATALAGRRHPMARWLAMLAPSARPVPASSRGRSLAFGPEPVHNATGPSYPVPNVLCYPLSGFSTMTLFLSASFFCGLLRTILTLALPATRGRLHTSCPASGWPCPLGWTLQWVQRSVPHLWAHRCLQISFF